MSDNEPRGVCRFCICRADCFRDDEEPRPAAKKFRASGRPIVRTRLPRRDDPARAWPDEKEMTGLVPAGGNC